MRTASIAAAAPSNKKYKNYLDREKSNKCC